MPLFSNQVNLTIEPYKKFINSALRVNDISLSGNTGQCYTNIKLHEQNTVNYCVGMAGYLWTMFHLDKPINVYPNMIWTTILNKITHEISSTPLKYIDFFIPEKAQMSNAVYMIPKSQPSILIKTDSIKHDISKIFKTVIQKTKLEDTLKCFNPVFSTDTEMSDINKYNALLQMINVYYKYETIHPTLNQHQVVISGTDQDYNYISTILASPSEINVENITPNIDLLTLAESIDNLAEIFITSHVLTDYFSKCSRAVLQLRDNFSDFFIPCDTTKGASANVIYGSICDLYDITEGAHLSEFEHLDTSCIVVKDITNDSLFVQQTGIMAAESDSKPVYSHMSYKIIKY